MCTLGVDVDLCLWEREPSEEGLEVLNVKAWGVEYLCWELGDKEKEKSMADTQVQAGSETLDSFFPDSWEALFNEIFFCWRMRASILSFFKREGKENLYLGTPPSQPLSHLLFSFFFLMQCLIVLMGLTG